jgi:broad specificity phosphatase PhoE
MTLERKSFVKTMAGIIVLYHTNTKMNRQITLIRHAKVDIDNAQKIDAHSLQRWVEEYDRAPIHAESLPTQETIVLAQSADVILTSTLRRASDSAKVLGVDVHEKNELFNEADIPKVNIPYLKLKPKSWLVILRLMLLLGLGKKDASLKASKSQAKAAAQKLMRLSQKYDNIALVGHGGMNWLIGKQLRKEGWALEGKVSHENWGSSVFKIE